MAADNSSSSSVHAVRPNLVLHVWERVLSLILPAIASNPGYEPEDVRRFCQAGKQILWVSIRGKEIEAAAVTEVLQYPRTKAVFVLFCGGSGMQAWLEAGLTEVRDYAGKIGAQWIEGVGRDGWRGALKPNQVETAFRISVEDQA